MNARTCSLCWGEGKSLGADGTLKLCPRCNGTGQDNAITVATKQRYRTMLRMAISNYLYITLHESTVQGDIDNMTEQSLDAIDSVVHSYPPLMSTSRLAPGG